MMVSFTYSNEPIAFEDDKIQLLVVENKMLFRKIISSFECDESDELFTFSKDFKPVAFSKYGFYISNLMNIDLNNKKLTTKINTYLEELANIEFNNELEEIIKQLVSLGDGLCHSSDFDCEFNYEITAGDIIKLLRFQVGNQETTQAEQLILFCKMMNKYLKTELFVIPHLHLMYNTDEIKLIYDTLLLNHIKLLAIEAFAPENKIDCEDIYILDKDLCFIDNASQ